MRTKKSLVKRMLAFALAVIVTATAIPTTNVWAVESDAQEIIETVVEDATVEETIETVVETQVCEADIAISSLLEDDAVTASVDSKGPVVTSVTLMETNSTLKGDATLHFTVKGYDEASVIEKISFSVMRMTGSGNSYGDCMANLIPTENENEYVGEFSLNEGDFVGGSTYRITNIKVIDGNGQATGYTPETDLGFKIESSNIEEEIQISLDKTEVVLTDENPRGELTVNVDVGAVEGVSMVYVSFTNGMCFPDDIWVYIGEDGKGVTNYTFASSTQEGTYYIDEVRIIYDDNTQAYLTNIPQDVSFTYKNNLLDQEGPVIKSVSVDKAGQKVESGIVTVTVVAEDASGFDENGYHSIRIASVVSNQISDGSKLGNLEYQGNGVFTATFDVADLHNSEWYVESVHLYDVYGNSGSYSDWYGTNKNACFCVVRDNNFIEKVYKNVTVQLYDGDKVIAGVTKDIPRGSTLESIFGEEYVEPVKEGVGKFLGWKIRFGQQSELYTNDSVVGIERDNDHISLVASFEKIEVTVQKYLLDADLKCGAASEVVIVEDGTTVADLIAQISAPKTVNGYKFTGWESYFSEDMLQQPINSSSIQIMATYDKYPVKITKSYSDENGNVVEEIVTKDYVAGTTFGQIISEQTAIKANNSTGWIRIKPYSHISSTEKVGIQNLSDFEFRAEYEDKVVVSIGVGYVVEEGKYAKQLGYNVKKLLSKELCSNRDKLSEYANEFAKGVKDTYPGLTVASWYPSVYDENNDGYYDSISVSKGYNESAIHLVGVYDKAGVSCTYIMFVKPGETVELPERLNGYIYQWMDYYTWQYLNGYSYKVPELAAGQTSVVIPFMSGILGTYEEKPEVKPETPEVKPEERPEVSDTAIETSKNQIDNIVSNYTDDKAGVDVAKKDIVTSVDSVTLTATMQTVNKDAEFKANIVKLEADYAKHNNITVEKPVVADEVKAVVKADSIEVVGAGLNGESGKSVKLNVAAVEAPKTVPTGYANAIQLDIKLFVGTEAKDTLDVPVAITMDVPAGVSTENLVILHYHGDASKPEVIRPEISGGKMTFAVSKFSTFVFANEEKATAPTAADENAYAYIYAYNAMFGGNVVTSPKTGDSNVVLMIAMLTVVTAAVVIVRRRVIEK